MKNLTKENEITSLDLLKEINLFREQEYYYKIENNLSLNKVEERNFEKGSNDDIRAFQEKLTHLGINATVRRELGSDISASCGQLRKKVI